MLEHGVLEHLYSIRVTTIQNKDSKYLKLCKSNFEFGLHLIIELQSSISRFLQETT